MNKLILVLLVAPAIAYGQLRIRIIDGTNTQETAIINNTNVIARVLEWSESRTDITAANPSERLAILLREYVTQESRDWRRQKRIREALESVVQENE